MFGSFPQLCFILVLVVAQDEHGMGGRCIHLYPGASPGLFFDF